MVFSGRLFSEPQPVGKGVLIQHVQPNLFVLKRPEPLLKSSVHFKYGPGELDLKTSFRLGPINIGLDHIGLSMIQDHMF